MPDSLGITAVKPAARETFSCAAPISVSLGSAELGAWAHELIGVGRWFARLGIQPPVTLALCLPTLDYAAGLVAAGYVAGRAESRHARATGGRAIGSAHERRFEQLCSLKVGAPVHVEIRTKSSIAIVLGSFVEVAEVQGEKYAKIKYQNATKSKGGEARVLIGLRDVNKVTFASGGDADQPPARKIGTVVRSHTGLAAGFVGDPEALPHLFLRSEADCVIVGVVKAISDELDVADFDALARAESPQASGKLQDIVRAAELSSAGDAVQTQLLSIHGEAEVSSKSPHVVIFRGSSAYVRKGESFPASHHIVLVSSTEPEFDVAVSSLNAAYVDRADECPDPDAAGALGNSAMAFTRVASERL